MTKATARRRIGASLCATGAFAIMAASPALAQADTATAEPGEIVVTAQKRAEPLGKVPVSALALSGAQLEARGIRDITDLARIAPGISLQGTDDSGDVNLTIRGIISAVGAPTTGIYIDDVPVHVRKDAGVWSDGFPRIFDLDRVEILRGPQGTLFGGSSEGGAVRFITPEASLTKTSGFIRASGEVIVGGAPGGELGAAIGMPLITDRLGLRISAWHEATGGYARRVDPVTGATTANDVNGTMATVVHISLKAQVTPVLTVTPALFFQSTVQRDRGLFWERAPGDYAIASRIPARQTDRMVLGTLTMQLDLGAVSVKAITAVITRNTDYIYDSTQYQFASFAPDLTFLPSKPDYLVTATFPSKQRSVSQEVRLSSSAGSEAPLSWVVGAFYQRMRERYDGRYADTIDDLANFVSQRNGNGPSDAASYFGEAPVDGRYSYLRHYADTVEELAGFGNATVRLLPRLTAAAGLRVSRSSFHFSDFQDGPWGPAAPTSRSGGTSDTSVLPRANLSYDVPGLGIAYATAAKGYRMGGVNPIVPANLCAADLAQLGLTAAPDTYASDNVWSYEVGSKARLMGGRLRIDSSAFWIDWNKIQQSVYLSQCGYGYTSNLGRARSRGFDIQWEWTVHRDVTLSGTAGYTDVRNLATIEQGGNILARRGDRLATPRWTVTGSAEYRFQPFRAVHGYARIDAQYAQSYPTYGSSAVYGADPLLGTVPALTVIGARIGLTRADWNLAFSVRNLANAHTSTYRYRDSIVTTPLALRDTRLAPRSFGFTIGRNF